MRFDDVAGIVDVPLRRGTEPPGKPLEHDRPLLRTPICRLFVGGNRKLVQHLETLGFGLMKDRRVRRFRRRLPSLA
jgi:hypothetical protein